MNLEKQLITSNLINFGLVALFSLLIGLAQRRLHPKGDGMKLFGTDRTFTFIGILGFILYIINPQTLVLYTAGWIMLSILLAMYYYNKLMVLKKYGITTIIIALITYGIAPLVITQPKWLAVLVVVTVLIFAEMKESFLQISQKFNNDEFITLGKFLAIAGVVLPIVPNNPIVSFLNITPYKIWLAVVVISTISYFSYILKKFVFVNAGIIVSGILGGLYSSTATTLIIARKSKNLNEPPKNYAAAIILATAMMYLRILIIMAIFNHLLAIKLLPLFLIMIVITTSVAIYFMLTRKNSLEHKEAVNGEDKNPLEFKVAMLFTVLYVAFTFITYYSIQYFGTRGLNILSLIVGVTDIDPFLINLFQGQYNVPISAIALACMQAIISNNIVKAIYAHILAESNVKKHCLIAFSIVVFSNIILAVGFYLVN